MKKREVKPYINVITKKTIYKLSCATGYSIKKITRLACQNAIKNNISYELSPYFKRNIKLNGTVFKGNIDALEFNPISKQSERISMAINLNDYDYLYNLAYAMETTVSKVITYTVEKSMSDFNFLNKLIAKFFTEKLNEEKTKLLLEIIKEANHRNDYDFSLASLLLYIIDEYDDFKTGVDQLIIEAVG